MSTVCIQAFGFGEIAALLVVTGVACFAFGMAAGDEIGRRSGDRAVEDLLEKLNPVAPEPTGKRTANDFYNRQFDGEAS